MGSFSGTLNESTELGAAGVPQQLALTLCVGAQPATSKIKDKTLATGLSYGFRLECAQRYTLLDKNARSVGEQRVWGISNCCLRQKLVGSECCHSHGEMSNVCDRFSLCNSG
jgi:hypothetical protein